MNWLIKIRLTIIIAVAFFCFAAQATAQKAESFEILSRVSKSIQSGQERPLIDERSEVAGSFTVEAVGDHQYQFKITLSNGMLTAIDALSFMFYSSQANRFFVVGAPLQSHVIAEIAIRVYSGSGQLIKDLGIVAHHPFAVGINTSGYLYVAGSPQPGSQAYFLQRIDPQGNVQWSAPLPERIPDQIKFSANGNYAGIVLSDPVRNTFSFKVYNNSGQMVHQNNALNNIAAFEIIGNDKVVFSDGWQWFLYPLQSNSLIAAGTLKGNVLGGNPITASPGGSRFAIVTLGDPKTSSGYRVQAFDSSTGDIVNESLFGGLPVWRPNRFVTFDNESTLKLTTEVETIRLKMD